MKSCWLIVVAALLSGCGAAPLHCHHYRPINVPTDVTAGPPAPRTHR